MVQLVRPCKRYLTSYIEAYDEYKLNGITTYSFDDARTFDIFAKYEDYRCGRNLKAGRVGADYYWLVDDEQNLFIGEVCIRHSLTEALKEYGGHIGYGVRFSQWNKGYGTLMLRLALEKARQLGIFEVLITCDDDNLRSAKVMENNGFVLQDKIMVSVNGNRVYMRRYTKRL